MLSTRLSKTCVIGPEGSGKTQLINRYAKNNFFTTDYKPTIGVDFALKIISDSETNIKHNLQLWDVSGKERFSSMISDYYKDSSAFLLVLDATKSINEIIEDGKKWINTIVQCPTFGNLQAFPLLTIVLNKRDLVDDDDKKSNLHSVIDELYVYYQNEMKNQASAPVLPVEFPCVSAKDDDGEINLLFSSLSDELLISNVNHTPLYNVVITERTPANPLDSLSDYWDKESKVATLFGDQYRAADTKKIGELVQAYDAADDDDDAKSGAFKNLFNATSDWLDNGFNQAVSERVQAVKDLRLQLYYDYCGQLFNDDDDYQTNISEIVDNLSNFIKSKKTGDLAFTSTHLRQVEAVFKTTLSDIDKLIAIQQIATHYSKSTLHNCVRFFTNLSQERQAEKQWVSELMSVIKKTCLNTLDTVEGDKKTLGLNSLSAYLNNEIPEETRNEYNSLAYGLRTYFIKALRSYVMLN